MKAKWTKEHYQQIIDWMRANGKTLEQAKEHWKFGSNSWYSAKHKWGDAKTKRTYTKKAQPAFIDLETTKASEDQAAIIIVPMSRLKTVMGALWQ